jgi:hypothetical protein
VTHVLPQHRLAYRGFAWAHPLRELYRATHSGADPVESHHPWPYAFRGLQWLVIGGASTGVSAASWLFLGFLEGYTLGLLFSASVGCLLSCGLLVAIAFEKKGVVRHFDEWVGILAATLGMTSEYLATVDWHTARQAAQQSLIDDARKVLLAEQQTPDNPFATGRTTAKGKFEQQFARLGGYGMLEHLDYGWYFKKAREK